MEPDKMRFDERKLVETTSHTHPKIDKLACQA